LGFQKDNGVKLIARIRNRRQPNKDRLVHTKQDTERVLLVGADLFGRKTQLPIQDSIDELGELALSAGAVVIGALTQKLRRYSQYYLGQGKLEELKQLIDENSISTVICDDELDPNQQKNLEKALAKVKVIDRTALILDIFASRAQTREGRLQVELAQHEYLLPRLAGQWSHLERLGGGIGTRGPGETQIETDRRLIRNRILKLKKDLESIRTHRNLYRERRRSSGVDVVGLVGYTNAGKSTLLNTLTKAGVAAEDKLFMTLDPVTRKLQLPNSKSILITDTVGFIQKLPTTLVAAFRATLEEIRETSAILHVVDITHPNAAQHVSVVTEVLKDLDVNQTKSLLILNKADLLSSSASLEDISILAPKRIHNDNGTPVSIVSAKNGTGISELLHSIQSVLED
tara:strand:+ start:1233 stop:2435 length:1203 start_codon:yes stop_codon:yes gene_type:complete